MSKEFLKLLGLNNNEIDVLSELLTIGSSVASTIAARTKINKSTVRYTCQNLEKKGLIFSIEKDNSYVYTAESPRRLHYLLEEDKKRLQKKEKIIEKSIKYFEGLKNKKTILPKVSFFKGREGLEKLYEKILDYEMPIDSFEDNGEMFKSIPDFVDYFITERKRRKIYNRVICPSNNPINEESEKELRSVKMIKENLFPFTGDIKICANHVSIMSFKENNSVAISITDEDIANNFRVLFEYMWKNID
ncbi:MAG: helix-turn-helix domain-containing protein [Candidatus Gracilibacteria bacterium]